MEGGTRALKVSGSFVVFLFTAAKAAQVRATGPSQAESNREATAFCINKAYDTTARNWKRNTTYNPVLLWHDVCVLRCGFVSKEKKSAPHLINLLADKNQGMEEMEDGVCFCRFSILSPSFCTLHFDAVLPFSTTFVQLCTLIWRSGPRNTCKLVLAMF